MTRREALERVAADYRTAPLQALEDLLTFCLEDDAAIARQTPHVTRRASA
jgi:hypothetical protein